MKTCDYCHFSYPDKLLDCPFSGHPLHTTRTAQNSARVPIEPSKYPPGIFSKSESSPQTSVLELGAHVRGERALKETHHRSSAEQHLQALRGISVEPTQLDFGPFTRFRKRPAHGVPKYILLKIRNLGAVDIRGSLTSDKDCIEIFPSEFELDAHTAEWNVRVSAQDNKSLKLGQNHGFVRLSTAVGGRSIPYTLDIVRPWWSEHFKLISILVAGLAVTIATVVPLVGALGTNPKHWFNRNGDPVINDIEEFPPDNNQIVKLVPNASDPDGDQLQYRWEDEKGLIDSGQATQRVVRLDPAKLHESGVQKDDVTLTVEDGHGGQARSKKTIIWNLRLQPMVRSAPIDRQPDASGALDSVAPQPHTPRPGKTRWATHVNRSQSIPGDYSRIMYLFRERKYGAALEACEKALRLNPNDRELIEAKRRIEDTLRDLDENSAPPTPKRHEEQSPAPPTGSSVSNAQELIHAKVERKAEPIYPKLALETRVFGTVVVEIEINEQGDVDSAKAIQGPVLLREAAEHAARRSKFRPASINGRAVRDGGTITYYFRLPNGQ